MFKSLTLAAAISVAAASAHAGLPADAFVGPTLQTSESSQIVETQDTFETASYCEWVTVYDYWGNWFTVWQCY